MKLLRAMMALQKAHGAVRDEALQQLAVETRTPLYHLEGLRGFYPVFHETPHAPHRVQVCRDLVCRMRGAAQLKAALQAGGDVAVEETSCLGRCDHAPAALVNDQPAMGNAETLRACALGSQPVQTPPPLPSGAPTGAPPHWPTDPYDTPDARYGLLRSVLAMPHGGPEAGARRDAIVAALKESGLRGMGGAGFPTGMKWELTRAEEALPKTVICNADESEPGTFKDRVILATLPHLLVEAMILAGWVIGAARGIIYLRHEYGPEKAALEAELARARAAGLLGDNLLGSGFSFSLEIFESPGGYIMGEETALLEALEDRRGEPRNKPPFPTRHGLHGLPTLINNVETFAAVPIIAARGGAWWAGQGLGGAAGLKFLSVSGDVATPGVVCVPMGTPFAQVLELCGGMAAGHTLAAFAPGGASSNFLPPDQAGVAMDFQPLADAGSMLGSGAVIVVGSGSDLLDAALMGLRFFRNESCGKCVPCRVGSTKAVAMVESALAGHPAPGLRAHLEQLGDTMARTSICGLGQIALQPLLQLLARFPVQAARLDGNGKEGAP